MSSLSELAKNILSSRRNPTKSELTDFIKSALELLAEIDDAYKKYFENEEGDSAIFEEVESKIQNIITEYQRVFPDSLAGKSISENLETKYEEIIAYHKKLLENPDSIEADIDDSQTKITAFYNELFGQDANQQKAKHINDFYDKLTSPEGIEAETDRLVKLIQEKYAELFEKNIKTKKSLIDDLEEGIAKADKYSEYIDSELQPLIDRKKAAIEAVDKDIKTKQQDIDALLSSATAKSLTQGFAESKAEYLNGVPKEYRKIKKNSNFWDKVGVAIVNGLSIFPYNAIGRYIPSLVNYVLFIAPLVIVVLIFNDKDLLKAAIDGTGSAGRIEAVYVKTVISAPMLWIAWYGQRGISQRKRLREEYNHKYRVLQVYLMFLGGESTYTLRKQSRDALEEIVLATVDDNPARYLGKNETYMDDAKNMLSGLDSIKNVGKNKGK